MKQTIKILPILLFSAILLIAQSADDDNPIALSQKAVQAFEAKDYPAYLELIQKAMRIIHDHPQLIYHLARAEALTGKTTEAIKNLKRTAMFGAGHEIDKAPGFESIANTPEFKEIAGIFHSNRAAKGKAEIAFKIPQKDLIPEGMAYDPVKNRFYVSSIYHRKIVEIDSNGKSRDFIRDKQDGIWGVVGMEVDAERRILWAAHGNLKQNMTLFEPEPETIGHTGVFKYDLTTGKLLKKFIKTPNPDHPFFNDLALAKNGDLYVSDSERGCIFRIRAAREELEELGCPEHMYYPNGITLTDDDRYLYIGHVSGMSVMDTKSNQFMPVEPPPNASTVGVDGMVTYGKSIIVNQAFANVERVTRFYYSNNPSRFEKAEVLQANLAEYNLPTTGVVARKSFYYIGNSQLRSFDENGKIFPEEKLQEPIILKIDLN